MKIVLGILTYVTLDESEDSQVMEGDVLVREKTQTKVAILGLFANLVDKEKLMKNVLSEKGAATIFMTMMKESGQPR